VTIYALIDPRDDAVRYVGRTDFPKQRFACHRSSMRGGNDRGSQVRAAWVRGLRRRGLFPEIRVLERCRARDAARREAHWIDAFSGPRLLNRKGLTRLARSYLPPKERRARAARRRAEIERYWVKRFASEAAARALAEARRPRAA
jgi:hypothetical protein